MFRNYYFLLKSIFCRQKLKPNEEKFGSKTHIFSDRRKFGSVVVVVVVVNVVVVGGGVVPTWLCYLNCYDSNESDRN